MNNKYNVSFDSGGDNFEYVKSYLRYLKDTSKKIALKTNFDSIFTKDTKENRENIKNFFLLEELSSEILFYKNDKNYKKVQNLYSQQLNSKKIYVGLFFLKHLVKIGNINKKILSPCMYLEAEIKKDDNSDTYKVLIEDELHLNLETLISFVNNQEVFDDQENNSFLDQIKTHNIFNINYDDDSDEIRQENMQQNLEKIFKKIIVGINELNGNEKVGLVPEYKNIYGQNIEQLIGENKKNIFKENEDTVSVFNLDKLIFAAEQPSELSTYKALESFIKEFEGNDLQSTPIIKFLNNKLLNVSQVFEKNTNIDDIVSLINKEGLPINLSPSQKRAIENCFENKISYIQGPPGTGKSHTITALIIISLILNKKILVVTQKPVALQAIKIQLNKILDGVKPYVLFESLNKKEEFESLEKYKDIILNEEKINLIIKEIESLKKEQINYESQINQHQSEINKSLSKEKDYVLENKKLIEKRDALFEDGFKFEGLPIKSSFLLEKENILKNKAKKLHSKKVKKIDFIFYQQFLSLMPKHNVDVIKKFIKDNIFDVRFSAILEANKLLLNSENKKIGILNIERISALKKEIEDSKQKIKEIYKKLIVLEFKRKVLEQNKQVFDDFFSLKKYGSTKHGVKKTKVAQAAINYDEILNVYNVWLSEIRNISEVLPNNTPEMFDLVVVDEASQVNIPEIIPVFYRGKNICVVGDDQQLAIDSTGLNFAVSSKLDNALWTQSFKGLNFKIEDAKAEKLIITKSSILDLLIDGNVPKIMLDEHYRSLPVLANFNSKRFYSGEVKVMTSTPDNINKNCVSYIEVPPSQRQTKKININEANKVIELIRLITAKNKSDFLKFTNQISLNEDCLKDGLFFGTIGVISYLRDQVNYIKELLQNNMDAKDVEKYEIICGTPEELQGQEKTIIFISTVQDDTSQKNSSHHKDEKRFNVTVSRAKKYNVFVCTQNANLPYIFEDYLKQFGFLNQGQQNTKISLIHKNFDILDWTFDYKKMDSEFERKLYDQIKKYIVEHQKTYEIFNQVPFAGYKIDFVIFNKNNGKFIGLEADGVHHFKENGDYANWHLDRMKTLTRSGWSIVNTKYSYWYDKCWIDIGSTRLKKEIERILSEIEVSLDGEGDLNNDFIKESNRIISNNYKSEAIKENTSKIDKLNFNKKEYESIAHLTEEEILEKYGFGHPFLEKRIQERLSRKIKNFSEIDTVLFNSIKNK